MKTKRQEGIDIHEASTVPHIFEQALNGGFDVESLFDMENNKLISAGAVDEDDASRDARSKSSPNQRQRSELM